MRADLVFGVTVLLAGSLLCGDALAQSDPATVGALRGGTEGEEGQPLTFGVIVDAPDGQPATFDWDFGDGETLSGPGLSSVAHEYMEGDSTYELSVMVSPANGAAVTRSMTVQIRNGAPRILTLQVEPDPSLERPVEFWAEAMDPGTDVLEYEWNFGDGSPPETGEELREVSHRYQERGRYEVRLTVRDEAEETTETITVAVGLDLVATLSGDLTTEVDGTTGPASMFAGFMPFNVGAPEHGVGRLSPEQCILVMGFWDEDRQIHVNFVWVPPPDRIFQPGEYRVLNSTQEAPAPGTIQAQVHVMTGDEATYDRARSDAETAAANRSLLVAAARVTRNFLDGFIRNRGGGNNATLYSTGGTFRVLRASESVVSAEFQMAIPGPRVRSGDMLSATIEGRFTWRPRLESTRMALADCEEPMPFSIVAHKPSVEEEGVDFVAPGIEVTFSRRYKPETITPQNVEVGYLNESGEFRRIDGRLVLDRDARTLWFQPEAESLLSGVYYHVRIRGGTGGVLGEQDEPLRDDYDWRFLTIPRAIPLSRGQGAPP